MKLGCVDSKQQLLECRQKSFQRGKKKEEIQTGSDNNSVRRECVFVAPPYLRIHKALNTNYTRRQSEAVRPALLVCCLTNCNLSTLRLMENHCRAHQYDQNLLKGPYAHFHLHVFLILGLCWSSFVWFPVQDNLYLSHSGIRCSPSEHHLCRENSVLALFPLCWLFVF